MKSQATRDSRGMKGVLLALQFISMLMIFSTTVHASAATRCDVLTIQASNDGKGIDSKLSVYSKIFNNKPFSEFNSFSLVEKQIVEIELNVPKSLRFPDKIGGSVQLNGISNGTLDLTITLSRAGKPPIRINGIAAPGSPIFAAGMKSTAGIWIFGIACDHDDNGIAY